MVSRGSCDLPQRQLFAEVFLNPSEKAVFGFVRDSIERAEAFRAEAVKAGSAAVVLAAKRRNEPMVLPARAGRDVMNLGMLAGLEIWKASANDAFQAGDER